MTDQTSQSVLYGVSSLRVLDSHTLIHTAWQSVRVALSQRGSAGQAQDLAHALIVAQSDANAQIRVS